jgi:hypothetical protein
MWVTVQKVQARMFEVWIAGFIEEFGELCKATTVPIFQYKR